MATQITFSIISESKPWYASPEFFPTPSSSRHADLVVVCAGCLLENSVLTAVRAAEFLDLQRQRQASGSVQERGHVLISTSFRGWT